MKFWVRGAGFLLLSLLLQQASVGLVSGVGLGSACSSGNDCAQAFQCSYGICGLPIGVSCTLGQNDCIEGAFCNPDYNPPICDWDPTLVRLVGFDGKSGRVEVNVNGSWGTVCEDDFDDVDATVVCNMFGFNTGLAFWRGVMGEGTGEIWMDNTDCDGSESSLFQCSIDEDATDCGHNEDVSVQCFNETDTAVGESCAGEKKCVTYATCDVNSACSWDLNRLRLVDGNSSAGRVEVFAFGYWGTVCDDDWADVDASVVCRMLGYGYGTATTEAEPFGPGTMGIFMDNVKCSGNESTIFECTQVRFGRHNCDHDEDAGVICNYFTMVGEYCTIGQDHCVPDATCDVDSTCAVMVGETCVAGLDQCVQGAVCANSVCVLATVLTSQGFNCADNNTLCQNSTICGFDDLCMSERDVLSTPMPASGRFGDCRRYGMGCGENGACAEDGTSCTCNAGFTQVHNFLCLADASISDACGIQAGVCVNDGQCLIDHTGQFAPMANDPACFCSPEFAGTSCEMPRFQTVCSELGMLLIFRPPPSFVGKVYVTGYSNDERCYLTRARQEYGENSAGRYALYSTNIDLESCGITKTVLADGSVQFQAQVMVQYADVGQAEPEVITYTDQSLTAICTFPPNSTIAQSALTVWDNNGDGSISEGDYSGVVNLEVMALTPGSTLPNIVPVGAVMGLAINFVNNSVFDDFSVMTATASNRPLDSDPASLAAMDFVVNGCPLHTVFNTGDITKGPYLQYQLAAVIPSRAVMFSAGASNGRNQLHFTVKVKLCRSQNGGCEQPTPAQCEADRKKRAVSDSSTNTANQQPEAILTASVLVTFSETSTGRASKTSGEITEECLQKPHLQNIVIVLSVLIFVFLVVCVVFTVLIIMHNRRQRRERDPK